MKPTFPIDLTQLNQINHGAYNTVQGRVDLPWVVRYYTDYKNNSDKITESVARTMRVGKSIDADSLYWKNAIPVYVSHDQKRVTKAADKRSANGLLLPRIAIPEQQASIQRLAIAALDAMDANRVITDLIGHDNVVDLGDQILILDVNASFTIYPQQHYARSRRRRFSFGSQRSFRTLRDYFSSGYYSHEDFRDGRGALQQAINRVGNTLYQHYDSTRPSVMYFNPREYRFMPDDDAIEDLRLLAQNRPEHTRIFWHYVIEILLKVAAAKKSDQGDALLRVAIMPGLVRDDLLHTDTKKGWQKLSADIAMVDLSDQAGSISAAAENNISGQEQSLVDIFIAAHRKKWQVRQRSSSDCTGGDTRFKDDEAYAAISSLKSIFLHAAGRSDGYTGRRSLNILLSMCCGNTIDEKWRKQRQLLRYINRLKSSPRARPDVIFNSHFKDKQSAGSTLSSFHLQFFQV